MPAALTIDLVVLDELLTTGEWCPHCALPSAVRLPWQAVNVATLRPFLRSAVIACQECHRHWSENA